MRTDIAIGDKVYLIGRGIWGMVEAVYPQLFESGGYYIKANGELHSVPVKWVLDKNQYKREYRRIKKLENSNVST